MMTVKAVKRRQARGACHRSLRGKPFGLPLCGCAGGTTHTRDGEAPVWGAAEDQTEGGADAPLGVDVSTGVRVWSVGGRVTEAAVCRLGWEIAPPFLLRNHSAPRKCHGHQRIHPRMLVQAGLPH